MTLRGVVKLNDDVIGDFEIDDKETITISFNKGAAGVRETLEFAALEGLNFGLQLNPEYVTSE